jgi:FkbM family methyltransferase
VPGHCYEPLPDNFALLKRNLGHLDGTSAIWNNFAVGDPSRTRLFLGRSSCGEASFYVIGEQSTALVDVETMAPSVLPKAQIMKIDTEGSEIDILGRMTSFDFDVRDLYAEIHAPAPVSGSRNGRAFWARLRLFMIDAANRQLREPRLDLANPSPYMP